MSDFSSLRLAAVAAFKVANTAAGQNVVSPDDWPTTAPDYPILVVRTPRNRKENVGGRNGPPAFFTTVTLTAIGRFEAVTEIAAETALEPFALAIENALLTNAQFYVGQSVQQFVSVETVTTVTSGSETHIGEAAVSFEIEIPEIYSPAIDADGAPTTQALTGIQGTASSLKVIEILGDVELGSADVLNVSNIGAVAAYMPIGGLMLQAATTVDTVDVDANAFTLSKASLGTQTQATLSLTQDTVTGPGFSIDIDP